MVIGTSERKIATNLHLAFIIFPFLLWYYTFFKEIVAKSKNKHTVNVLCTSWGKVYIPNQDGCQIPKNVVYIYENMKWLTKKG